MGMTDTAYIVSIMLEDKIAIAENNGQNALFVTLDVLKEITALLKEKEAKLLKEQEAKLLTFDEVKKHYSIPDELTGNLMESIDYSFDIAPLYMECPDEDQWVVHWRDYRSIEPFLEGWREDYGKTWRCWTTKPTAEQRSAAKWN